MEAQRKKILFIEDDGSMSWLLRETFKHIDADFTFAASAIEGKARIDHSRFDLIVCDYHLGDGLGIDLFKHVKAISPETQFILFTSMEDIFPELKTSTFTFIQKPELGILLERVKGLLLKSE